MRDHQDRINAVEAGIAKARSRAGKFDRAGVRKALLRAAQYAQSDIALSERVEAARRELLP